MLVDFFEDPWTELQFWNQQFFLKMIDGALMYVSMYVKVLSTEL